MARGGPFNQVKITQPRRHFFDMSYVKLYTCKWSQLIPVCCEECLPGDRWKISNQSVIRLNPMVAPVLGEIRFYTEYFFVPTRLVCKNWQAFITGYDEYGNESDVDLTSDYLHLDTTSTPVNYNTLWDYFGLPVYYRDSENSIQGNRVNIGISDDSYKVLAFAFRAYKLIYNYFYRDENLDPALESETDPIITQSVLTFDNQALGFLYPLKLGAILHRHYHKDFFISSLLSPQLGDAPSINFGGTRSLVTLGNYDIRVGITPSTAPVESLRTPYFSSGAQKTELSFRSYGDSTGVGSYPASNSHLNSYYQSGSNYYGANYGVDIPISGFTASDIRLLMQLQLFLERNNRFGHRLNEFLLAHFGISPRDSVLQEPEYIGGSRSNILVSEVLQTSATEENSPLGTQGGRGLGVSTNYIGQYTCSEHGYLIGLASVMPSRRLYEAQGFSKHWTRKTRYDYYFPEFAHLSEQPVYKDEIAANLAPSDDIWGYQPIYSEYRSNQDMAVGQFRHYSPRSLDYWTLSTYVPSFDDHVGALALNSDFITPKNSQLNKIFQVQDEDPFLIHFANILKAYRPIAPQGLPFGLYRF